MSWSPHAVGALHGVAAFVHGRVSDVLRSSLFSSPQPVATRFLNCLAIPQHYANVRTRSVPKGALTPTE